MPSKKGPKPITDLLSFYDHWPSLRDSMVSISKDGPLTNEDRATLAWLILLADRVGPADLRD